jgi:hypothetical protein
MDEAEKIRFLVYIDLQNKHELTNFPKKSTYNKQYRFLKTVWHGGSKLVIVQEGHSALKSLKIM